MKNIPEDELLHQHDIKLQELDIRLRQLDNLINTIHNQYGVWWDEIEDH